MESKKTQKTTQEKKKIINHSVNTKIMSRYLDPKNDLIFKLIFGEHKHLCMSLLNSLLPLEKPIVSIEYQTGELLPEIELSRHYDALEKGALQNLEKVTVNSHKAGLSMETIMAITDLSSKQITEILKQHGLG